MIEKCNFNYKTFIKHIIGQAIKMSTVFWVFTREQ